MSHIPPAAANILKALCSYHFLTKPQMVELGLARSVGSLDNHALLYLAPKRDKQTGQEVIPKGKRKSAFLCRSLTYGLRDDTDKPGKNHFMYYLTPAGLDRAYWELEPDFRQGKNDLQPDTLWIPSEHERLSNDYHHRRHYVSAHIAVRQWAARVGAKIDFWHHYYQSDPHRPKLHGRPPSINRVHWEETKRQDATPDGLLGITYQGKSRLFVLELHHRTPTKLVTEQLYRDFRAGRAIRAKFIDYPVASDPFVLSVFTDANDQRNAQTHVLAQRTFDPVAKGLLFTSVPELSEHFAEAWVYADGSPSRVFQ